MASNKELANQARTLSEQLGVQVETSGLNNAKLTDLVNDLLAQVENKTSQKDTPMAEQNSNSAAPAPIPPVSTMPKIMPEFIPSPPKPTDDDLMRADSEQIHSFARNNKYRFTVAAGKSVVGGRGCRRPGDEITLADVRGNEEALEHLIAIGCVVDHRAG